MLLGSWIAALLGSSVAGLLGSPVAASADSPCTPATELVHIPGVAEASGVAASRQTPGLIWTHNDSGEPVLHAIDASGTVTRRVEVRGARVADWEDLAVGPCPHGSCLYIADIGDNNRSRGAITIYRIPEPRPDRGASEPAEVWNVTYPDGAHDAEALFVSGSALFVVTKDESSATALYRLPLLPKGGRDARLERVSRIPIDRVTGASASPDGAWVALRNHDALLFYRTRDLVGGAAAAPRQVDLAALGEPQGEGVAIGADGLVYLVGEGGGRGGTLATLRCTLR
jgi:hypothetical protein